MLHRAFRNVALLLFRAPEKEGCEDADGGIHCRWSPLCNTIQLQPLTVRELQAIAEKECNTERLCQVRDIFLFSCYTGLAYVDVRQLTSANIVIGMDGEKWIFTHRQKTDVPSKIPLLPQALAIVEKYSNHPYCINTKKLLPVLSNQKTNEYIKELAAICGINKEFTFHTARHTFATTVTLTNGVPIESVSKMLGHKNLRTTQHYAKILDKKVSQDMLALKEKMRNKPLMAITKTGT